MMIGYSSTFMDKIIERANKRQERMEKIMFNYDADAELDEIDGGITNEEWIHTLDTEGLVDYLYEVHKGGNTVERQAWIEKHKERVKMQFRGWLKAVHKE